MESVNTYLDWNKDRLTTSNKIPIQIALARFQILIQLSGFGVLAGRGQRGNTGFSKRGNHLIPPTHTPGNSAYYRCFHSYIPFCCNICHFAAAYALKPPYYNTCTDLKGRDFRKGGKSPPPPPPPPPLPCMNPCSPRVSAKAGLWTLDWTMDSILKPGFGPGAMLGLGTAQESLQ